VYFDLQYKIKIARNCVYNAICSLKVTTAFATIWFQKGKWDFRVTYDLLIVNATTIILTCWEITA
jgi:hypothetical protein